MTTADQDIDRLADALTACGELTDQEWRRSMHAVPRHLFIPERGYAMPASYLQGPPAHTIDRSTDPEGWWTAVYSNMSVITQRDDGAGDPASAEGSASSSNSAPGVVFPFLELLDPIKGERILDIGTGTGWTAALLSDRVGSEAVTSIEDDAQVTTTRLGPAQVMDAEAGADLALIMNVPQLVMLRMLNDGTKSCFLAEVDDPKGSWATCDSSPTGEHTVTQYGDRRLWTKWKPRSPNGPSSAAQLPTGSA